MGAFTYLGSKSTHAVTAAGVARDLRHARSFRIMAGEFSTGGEKSVIR
jgi:hypothetical protein